MCQYELWVYTRCRSTSPPIPPLPPSFPQHLLSPPPDRMGTITSNAYSAALISKTYPHTNYYRVSKCPLSPDCAPPSFAYLAPPPPPSPRMKRRMIANAQANLPPQIQAPPQTSTPMATEEAPSSPAVSQNTGNAVTETPPIPKPVEQVQSHRPQQPQMPVHVRHSYCHTCYEILKETIDGDGELCFPIGSDNWLNSSGKSTGKCWMMDERAARGDIIVDLDYSTGIDWGVELEAFHPSTPGMSLNSPYPQVQPHSNHQEHTEQVAAGAMKAEKDLQSSQDRETLQKQQDERERMKIAASKELERRKMRVLAENLRKRRWKGWEAWGAPYVVPSAHRVGRAGAS